MAGSTEIFDEIKKAPTNIDAIRRKYLKKFSEYRKRNVIAYYSGFLQKSGAAGVGIDDNDMNGFMNTIHQLDRSRGLDLILHTPGGNIGATETIIQYLHNMFDGDIVAFVPQIAMSAGTMICCCAKEIYMGKQSSLGPIDPQIGGISADGVIEEYEKACDEIKTTPSSIPIWQTIFSKIPPSFIGDCEKAIERGKTIVKSNMKKIMFPDKKDHATVDKIVSNLSSHKVSKHHSKHFSLEECKRFGLKIVDLEADHKLQDLLLSVHHSYMHTFSNTNLIKIIENQKDKIFVLALAK